MSLDPIVQAAGVLLIADNGQALFLKRGPTGDLPGTWCAPGGKIEDGEDAQTAALRELREETGVDFNGKLVFLMRNVAAIDPAVPPGVVSPKVDFTTFVSKGGPTFEPKINDEHCGYAWAPLDAPPEPLHPGVRTVIARLTMDELDIARAMRDGVLSSPQRYMNVWLYAMRITGTGTSYRSKDNEFVYRRPENYLSQDFLDRCNGLQVIVDHPKTNTLNSKEFSDRTVGAIMLPYILGDEVWGIAKIYDDATAEMMDREQMSTSPAVVFRALADNTKMKMDDGSTLLIEGKPALLDHLAICERGVWDKGEEPSGIRVDSSTGEKTMPTPEEIAAKEKADAEEKTKADAAAKKDGDEGNDMTKFMDTMSKGMDALCGKMDSVTSRMDAFESKDKEKADAEAKAKADAEAAGKSEEEKKADAEAKEKADAEEKEKADAEARVKSDADTKARIDALEKKLPRALTDAEIEQFSQVQAKADSVYQAHGSKASRSIEGETLLDYRKRLVGGMKAHSKTWKDSNIVAIADSATFDAIETQVYSDAMHVADNPPDLPAGQLRQRISTDPVSGQRTISFYGSQSFIHGMKRPGRRVTNINIKRAS